MNIPDKEIQAEAQKIYEFRIRHGLKGDAETDWQRAILRCARRREEEEGKE